MNNEKITQREAIQRLIEMQYERNEFEFSRGTFRVRGDVLDIFPAESAETAVRITLFDDEVESMTLFDPLTGRTLKKVSALYGLSIQSLCNAQKHYVAGDRYHQDGIEGAYRIFFRSTISWWNCSASNSAPVLIWKCSMNWVSAKASKIIRGTCPENPGEPPPTLVDYLPQNSLMVIDESHVTIPQVGGMYKGDRSRKENLVDFGFRLLSAMDNRPLDSTNSENDARNRCLFPQRPAEFESASTAGQVVEQVVRPTGLVDPQIEVRPAMTQVDNLMSEVSLRTAQG